MKNLSGLVTGSLFGVGLAASGMTNTEKVIGFLDVFGRWDSDLLFVMGFAVLTAAVGYRWVWRSDKPLFAEQFFLPTSKTIDRKLILGAIFFGLGWGLYGYCPGPAIAALVYLSPATLGFVVCMLIGMAIANQLLKLMPK